MDNKLFQIVNNIKVSALVDWLENPIPVREGPGSIPARVRQKLFSVYSMDIMINPPMPFLTLNRDC